MSLEEENLRLLGLLHPETRRALEQPFTTGPRLRVAATSSGLPTAILDDVFLHSRYDPGREAAAQVEKEIDPEASAVLVIGFGLGYGAEAVRSRYPGLPLLVIEPDIGMFRAALSSRSFRALLSDPHVMLNVGGRPEGLPALLEKLPLAKPGFLRLRPAWEKNPAGYRAVEEVVHSWLLRKDINVNTLKRFGRLWVRNLTRNVARFATCPGVALLDGLCSGIPALVVAGGPSFDDIAPRLPELARRLLIVCVNTSLKPCLSAGVQPDFAVVVDPQYWASRYLDWTPGWQGMLIAEPSTHPRVFRSSGSGVFLCSSLFPLGESLEAAVGEKGKLGAGGSVATSAWDLARLLGASPLYTAGLDLGFPGMRTHCRGVFTEGLLHSASGRREPIEGKYFAALREIGLFPVRSASGGLVPTDRRMLLYKWWFENQLEMRPDVKSFTLSPRGVEIKGMSAASVEELLALPVAREEIGRRMARAQRIREQALTQGRTAAALRESIDALIDGLDRLEDAAARGITLSHSLEGLLARQGDAGPCLRDLDEVDRSILDISTRTIAAFLMQPIIHGISGEGEKKATAKEIVARGLAVYEGIAESAGWQKKLLGRAAATLASGERRFP